MIRRIRAFGAFWYGFIIGDDWRVAVGVAVTLALIEVLSRTTHAPGWPLMVVAVMALLAVSIRTATRDHHKG